MITSLETQTSPAHHHQHDSIIVGNVINIDIMTVFLFGAWAFQPPFSYPVLWGWSVVPVCVMHGWHPKYDIERDAMLPQYSSTIA